MDTAAVTGSYGKAYASCDGGVAVARLAEHRGYRFEMARSQNITMSRVEKHGPAVEVKQNARPARHEDPTVPSTPANGRESKRPIDDQIAEGFVQVESGGRTAPAQPQPQPCNHATTAYLSLSSVVFPSFITMRQG